MSTNTITLDNFINTKFSSNENKNFHEEYENMRFLYSPQKIYNYLDTRVFKMEEAKKALSMFVFKAIKKHTNIEKVLMIVAESGTGKSHLISVLSEIVPNLVIIDGASLVPQGYKGSNHLTSALSQLNTMYDEPAFIVIDEFNRTLQKAKGSWSDSSLLSELLVLFDDKNVKINASLNETQPCWVSPSQLFFILLGSFSDITDQLPSKKIGFNISLEPNTSHRSQITKEQVLNTLKGWPEIAGRINRIVVSPNLTEEDYLTMLNDFQYSPIIQIEDELGITIKISQKKMRQLAKAAYENCTGFRQIKNILLEEINDKLFLKPDIQKIFIR